MPERVHKELQRQARGAVKDRCYTDKNGRQRCFKSVQQRRQAFVYGGMRRQGWKPKPKGTRAEGSNL